MGPYKGFGGWGGHRPRRKNYGPISLHALGDDAIAHILYGLNTARSGERAGYIEVGRVTITRPGASDHPKGVVHFQTFCKEMQSERGYYYALAKATKEGTYRIIRYVKREGGSLADLAAAARGYAPFTSQEAA